MCTAGILDKRYLFKNRDLGPEAGYEEDIARGYGVYRYIGVAGHATPKERGLNSGMNEKGVAAQMTYVGPDTLENAINTQMPRGVLIETILQNAGNLEEALDIAVRLLNRFHFVGGNILINSPQGSAVIEELYPRYCVERREHIWTVRTNHFKNLRLPEQLLPEIDNSRTRFRRFHELLHAMDAASVVPDDIRKALGDHENGADAICRHGGGENPKTVSTVVYDLENLRMHYLYGNPCETAFSVYEVKETGV